MWCAVRVSSATCCTTPSTTCAHLWTDIYFSAQGVSRAKGQSLKKKKEKRTQPRRGQIRMQACRSCNEPFVTTELSLQQESTPYTQGVANSKQSTGDDKAALCTCIQTATISASKSKGKYKRPSGELHSFIAAPPVVHACGLALSSRTLSITSQCLVGARRGRGLLLPAGSDFFKVLASFC